MLQKLKTNPTLIAFIKNDRLSSTELIFKENYNYFAKVLNKPNLNKESLSIIIY
jgi:hypothetical protein